MLVYARLICSDDGCEARYEAIAHVAEVESLGCDCGYGLQVLGWPDAVEGARDGQVALAPLDR
jgi:hypothetical protein